MHLKRLELYGFKSFAERTVLSFEHGLTGIVGPNGCGKSNVVDAVRWVLGEQRPTSMRGSEMIDVIFKGSAARAALSVAEVSLVLDNADGSLDGRGPEVAITRRVFRGGEGEYLLDGEKVRLKDIRGMLYDTGLGSRGYAVLEQGKIDAVLSADPLERRGIFEEAAGVSRYRAQRKEIAARLERVQQDMLRLDDVIGELETRVRSLKIQAGRAERWAEARDTWRAAAERLARHQVYQARQRLSGLLRDLAGKEAREAQLRELRTTAEEGFAAREREQRTLAAEIERVGSEASELAAELRALDERRSNLSQRIAAARESSAEEGGRAGDLEAKLALREAELASVEAAAQDLEARAGAALDEAARAADALRECQRRLKLAREESQAQNEKVLACLHERSASQSDLEHSQAAIAPLMERERVASERATEAGAALAAALDARKGAASSAEEAGARLIDAQATRAGLEERAAELERSRARLETEKQEHELERARQKSRIESLLDWERERSGLASGARALLEGELQSQVAGLLADHLRTPTRYARALDAVLGERAQALVLQGSEQAAPLLAWLKQGRHGQARLVAPTGFGPMPGAEPESPPERAAREQRGRLLARADKECLLGSLRDFVQPSPGFERLADLLLRDIWLVRDLPAALELVRGAGALRCVTPEGDLVEEAGVLGGHREVAQGPVGRRASADELSQCVAELSQRIAGCEVELSGLGCERVELEQGLRVAARDLEQARAVLSEARAAGQTAEARCAELARAAAEYGRESASALAERETAERLLLSASARLEAANRGFENENRRHSEIERERIELESERERRARAESETRVQGTRLSEQQQAQARRAEDLRRALSETSTELERARRLAHEQAQQAADCEVELEQLGKKRGELLEGRGTAEQRLSELRALERAGRVGLESLRERADALTRELEGLSAESAGVRMEAQKLELERAEALRRADEELQLREADLADAFEPEPALESDAALARLASEVAEHKRALDKLGPVNSEAVAELSEVAGRFSFLTSQRSDVLTARGTLEQTLARINAESEKLFQSTFAEIQTNFQALFRRLFGGGKADIALAAGVSALEAGIEISARPPGREMLPIGLLSGGQRTLTALALLFAVFQARPSPFCLLDEVDAALDDLNIQRFLDMLEGFREGTQFVVVTHNKGTMSACQALYGITMEVRGVSRKVLVELSEVDSFVPEAKGTAMIQPPRPLAEPELLPTAEPEPVVVLEPATRHEMRATEGAQA